MDINVYVRNPEVTKQHIKMANGRCTLLTVAVLGFVIFEEFRIRKLKKRIGKLENKANG